MRKTLLVGAVCALIASAIYAKTDGLTVPAPAWVYAVANQSTAWSSFTPANVTCETNGPPTTSAVSGRQKTLGKTVHYEINITITTVGTCAGAIFTSLPSTANAKFSASGADASLTRGLMVFTNGAASSTLIIYRSDGTTAAASSADLYITGIYESQ